MRLLLTALLLNLMAWSTCHAQTAGLQLCEARNGRIFARAKCLRTEKAVTRASLVGPQGPAGPMGPQGPIGTTGINGSFDISRCAYRTSQTATAGGLTEYSASLACNTNEFILTHGAFANGTSNVDITSIDLSTLVGSNALRSVTYYFGGNDSNTPPYTIVVEGVCCLQ